MIRCSLFRKYESLSAAVHIQFLLAHYPLVRILLFCQNPMISCCPLRAPITGKMATHQNDHLNLVMHVDPGWQRTAVHDRRAPGAAEPLQQPLRGLDERVRVEAGAHGGEDGPGYSHPAPRQDGQHGPQIADCLASNVDHAGHDAPALHHEVQRGGEPKNAVDLPNLVEGLKRLAKSDALVRCSASK